MRSQRSIIFGWLLLCAVWGLVGIMWGYVLGGCKA